MKILAVIELAPDARLEDVRARLADELRESWALFASDVLREAYSTASPGRVVFMLEAEDAGHAEAQLRRLPLVAEGLCRLGLTELRPFTNWSLLFANRAK